MTEQEMQFKLMESQEKVNALRQEVAAMNKECEYWQQVRIQAAIAAMQGLISGNIYTSSTIRLAQERGQSGTEFIAQMATEFADDLIEELQKKGGEDENN
jgi:polyhydroxyalkanoate synthesis regulator phasin